MIPEYYEFLNSVKIMSGKKALEGLPYELKQLGAKRPMIITDKGVVKANLVRTVLKAVSGSKIIIGAVFEDTPMDSSLTVVKEIADIYRKKKCDSLIAVGGGSVIDTAKGVNLLVTEDTDDLMKFTGSNRLRNPLKPLIVIPTTAGTGSEVTSVAVIANPEKGIKMSFLSPYLLPDIAMLDPRMTETMPAKITAATGMDALTHAVEAFISPQKNPVSDAFSTKAIELIRDNLITAVKKGRDSNARLAMANAALLAGIAFSNSMVGIIHATAHACGGVAHVPHGAANAILLPHGLEFNMKKSKDGIGEILPHLIDAEEAVKVPKKDRALKTIEAIRGLNSQLHKLCGHPTKLSDTGVTEEQLEEIAKKTIDDGASLFNPIDVNYNEALNLLKAAL